jgi:hypothetical protein
VLGCVCVVVLELSGCKGVEIGRVVGVSSGCVTVSELALLGVSMLEVCVW